MDSALRDRLLLARSAATYKAWSDMLSRFSSKQRQDIANLLAHDWTICEIKIESKYGGKPEIKVAAKPIPTCFDCHDTGRKFDRQTQDEVTCKCRTALGEKPEVQP
jgi:hypothetical protein